MRIRINQILSGKSVSAVRERPQTLSFSGKLRLSLLQVLELRVKTKPTFTARASAEHSLEFASHSFGAGCSISGILTYIFLICRIIASAYIINDDTTQGALFSTGECLTLKTSQMFLDQCLFVY